MFIYNNVLFSVARASAPEFISLVTPTFNALVVPSVTLIISIIGSLITLQSGAKDMALQYNRFINGSGYNSSVHNLSRFKILDLIFDEFGLNRANCNEEFACEIGRITGENVPLIKFLASKVWSNSTQLDSNSFLDRSEKVFIRSLLHPRECAKVDYNCGLFKEMEKAINRVKFQMLTTTTTTTTTPAPIQPRSRFGFNLDLQNWLEILNEIIEK
uniref:Uncharacterized protein n=1 Tax=Tetranychus urticae TaxID=32264 RepID=T1KV02_TETUR